MEDHFPATKTIVVNYKKMSTPGTVPKHRLGFSYILSEDYEFYQNFNDTELKNNQTKHPTRKLKHYKIVVLIEGYSFDDTNLTGGATFPNALNKHAL